MESRLLPIMLLTDVGVVSAFRATNDAAALPTGPGAVVYGGWPGGSAWDEFLPTTTW